MEDFIVYGNTFEEAMENIEKVLTKCQERNISLSNEKCHMLLV
jgi:predicted RNase H-like HicB family nuclease